MVERMKFKSGLEVVFRCFSERDSSAIGLWVKEGARREAFQLKGIAHFLEHLLFKGSRKYSYRKIKQEIEGRGGQLNGFTSQEVTCYFAKVLNKNVERALDILSDMVTAPLLLPEDIERERRVVLEEIKMYNDMPSSRVVSLLDSILWPGQPLGKNVLGTEDSLRRIKREDLEEFRKRFYQPRNIILVICSSSLPSLRGLKKKFSSLKNYPLRRLKRAKTYKGLSLKEETTSFEQTHINLGFPAFSYFHPQRFVLELIHIILGANMSSRLFESVREKRGLAYEISSSVRRYRDTGAFTIHCGLDSKALLKVFRVIIKELERLKKEPVSTSELKRAKDYLWGNFLMSQEVVLNSMFYIGESMCIRGRVMEFSEMEERIFKVSACQIRDLARKIFSYDKLKIAVISNQKDCIKHLKRSLR